MRARKEEPNWLKQWVRPLATGAVVGVLACLACLVLLAVLLLTQETPQTAVTPLSLVALVTGAFVGGVTAARTAGQNGWLMGLCCGGVLFLLLMLLGGFAMLRDTQAAHTWVKLAIMAAAGAVGGIVGINLRKRR